MMILIPILLAVTPSYIYAYDLDPSSQAFCQQAKPVVQQLRTCNDLDSCVEACESIAIDHAMRNIANNAAYKVTGAPLFEYCDIESLQTQKTYHAIADSIETKQRDTCNKKSRKKRPSRFIPKKILSTAQ